MTTQLVLTPVGSTPQSVSSVSDLTVASGSAALGSGDLIFKTDGAERARISNAGDGTGLFGGSPGAKQRGRRRVVDELSVSPMPNPPTQSFSSATSIIDQAHLAVVTSIANGSWITPSDARFKYLGGAPETYTPAGQGAALKTVVTTNSFVATYGYTRQGRQWAVEFDVECSVFEIPEYANASQWMNIYVDGVPVWDKPNPQSTIASLSAGSIYLRKIAFAARGRHTIRLVMESQLFGGIYLAKADTMLPATTGNSLTALVVGDSYANNGVDGASNDSHRTDLNWVFRMARRVGLANVWQDGLGGTGVLATAAGTVDKYGDRSSRWPTSADLVVVQGSINDSAGLGNSTFTSTQLKTATVALLAQLRSAYPNAHIVMLGIVRTGNLTADDTTANTAYSQAVTLAANSKTTFVDASALGWFSGTGKSGSPANDGNADKCLSSDGNHPTTEGHRVLGDRVAAVIPDDLGLPMVEPSGPHVAPRYRRIALGGPKQWNAQAALTAELFENGAATDAGSGAAQGAFYLDPVADGLAKLRLRATVITNATAPGMTFTFSLKAVGASSGGTAAVVVTAGSDVTGSSVAIATPALNTQTHSESADFDCPIAGWYAIVVVLSGNMAVDSAAVNRASLEARDA